MSTSSVTRISAGCAAGVLALGVLPAAAGAAPVQGSPAPQAVAAVAATPSIKVTLAGTAPAGKKTFKVVGSLHPTPGPVRFSLAVPHGGGAITMFKLRKGYTEAQFLSDEAAADSAASGSGDSSGTSTGTGQPSAAMKPARAAKNLRSVKKVKAARASARAGTDTSADAEFQQELAMVRKAERNMIMVGGIDARKGHPSAMTVKLEAGTYYLSDLDSDKPFSKKVVVAGKARTTAVPVRATVTAADDNKIVGDTTLPARGAVKFRSTAHDGWHYLFLQRLRSDATQNQLTRFFTFGEVPAGKPFFVGGMTGYGMLSRGRGEVVTLSLPAGTYMVADLGPDLVDFTPHAFKGMFRLVKLK